MGRNKSSPIITFNYLLFMNGIQPSLLTEVQIPFVYIVTPDQISGNASDLDTLNMQSDSAFELHAIMASTDLDADTDFMPNNFSVSFSDQNTGRSWMNARVPQRILCGPSNGLGRLFLPVIFPPQTSLSFDFLNLTGSNINITLALVGRKLFTNQA